jgi:PAP2 superfamily
MVADRGRGRMFTKIIKADPGASIRMAGLTHLERLFPRAEIILLGCLGLLIALSVGNAVWNDQAVAWGAFAPAIAACLAMVGIGAYIRRVKHAPRLAVGVIGFGVFMAFTGAISIFAYTLFPFSNPRIDLALMAFDARFGFVWTDFVHWIATLPGVGRVLSWVYVSSLFQMVAVILLLAFLNRPAEVHRFLFMGILSMSVTIAIWRRWPSIGPPAYVSLPPEVEAKAALIADVHVGETLLRFATKGNAVITPEIITGIVSFPSFHLIMAFMVMWFTRQSLAFVPALIVNLAMIPAALLHGGHHLIDMPAGIATFALCLWVTYKIIPEDKPGS